jgi:hypothetical protein
LVTDRRSTWGSAQDTSRKLGRLSIYQAFSPTRYSGMENTASKKSSKEDETKDELVQAVC